MSSSADERVQVALLDAERNIQPVETVVLDASHQVPHHVNVLVAVPI